MKSVGHASRNCKTAPRKNFPAGVECYTFGPMYARKFKADISIGAERRPAPLDWLDSFCMRNFTGSAEFDDTLPTGEGQLEAGLNVDPTRLAAAMSDWFTKRGKGNGLPVIVELREMQ
jgi:hypothetical protein